MRNHSCRPGSPETNLPSEGIHLFKPKQLRAVQAALNDGRLSLIDDMYGIPVYVDVNMNEEIVRKVLDDDLDYTDTWVLHSEDNIACEVSEDWLVQPNLIISGVGHITHATAVKGIIYGVAKAVDEHLDEESHMVRVVVSMSHIEKQRQDLRYKSSTTRTQTDIRKPSKGKAGRRGDMELVGRQISNTTQPLHVRTDSTSGEVLYPDSVDVSFRASSNAEFVAKLAEKLSDSLRSQDALVGDLRLRAQCLVFVDGQTVMQSGVNALAKEYANRRLALLQKYLLSRESGDVDGEVDEDAKEVMLDSIVAAFVDHVRQEGVEVNEALMLLHQVMQGERSSDEVSVVRDTAQVLAGDEVLMGRFVTRFNQKMTQ